MSDISTKPKKVFRAKDTMFENSQCLFIEFNDVVAMPYLSLLFHVRKSPRLNQIFNMDELNSYNVEGLFEWYRFRKTFNPFESIPVRENISIERLGADFCDKLLNAYLNASYSFYQINTDLAFKETLDTFLKARGLVKSIYFYSRNEESMINTYIDKTFPTAYGKIKYVFGDINDVLKDIPSDTTYVFSDIENINSLIDLKRLNCCSILISNGFRYNYTYDDPHKLKIDIAKLNENYIFNYSFFNTFDIERGNKERNGVPPELSELKMEEFDDVKRNSSENKRNNGK